MPYCLAKTAVNGEVVIQENSETYSASASALASGTTFKDAAKVATIDSNTAATIAARAAVDNILLDYSYVLSDANITSMINNSLKTTIAPIKRLMLKRIASTVDGLNYILNKDTTIAENEYLLIPNDHSLTIDVGKFIFNNSGIISVGERDSPAKGCAGCSTTNKADSSTTCCVGTSVAAGNLLITNTSSYGTPTPTNGVTGSITVLSGYCWQIQTGVTFYNYGTITNSGCVWLAATDSTEASATLLNASYSGSGIYGAFNNKTGGYIYSDGS